MFLTGDALKARLNELDRKAKEATAGAVWMEEFIALPGFGQIMVRFQTDGPVSLEQMDAWERQLRALAADAFLIDFMGSVYRQLGVDYEQLNEIIERLGQRFSDEPATPGPYAEQIRKDAKELLCRCELPEDTPVWEIQWEEGAYSLLLLGRESRFIRTVEGKPPVHLYEANGHLGESLMRAAFAARRLGVSLGRLMLDATEKLP